MKCRNEKRMDCYYNIILVPAVCRVNAQTIAVKTNVLPWMTGTLNLGW